MTSTTAADPLVQYTDDIEPRPIPEALLAARRDVMAAVRELATLTDADMETSWAWNGDGENEIRYGFYEISENFERAGIDAEAAIRASNLERGRAADLIAPATAARWDLQGILLQLPDAAWDADPGDEQWTVRQTLGHTIGGQRHYGAATAWWQAQALPADANLPKARPPSTTCCRATRKRKRARRPSSALGSTTCWIGRPNAWRVSRLSAWCFGSRWMGYAIDVGFRIGRWSSHIREHTIQVEKTMVMLGHAPTEVDRLIRLVLAAWGRAEAAVYGSADAGEALAPLAATAARARVIASEVTGVVRG